MRINKFISDQGHCSRREADKLIESGRVKLNSRVAVLGDKVQPGDQVFIDGQLLENRPPDHEYIMYNKPLGITTTTDLRVEGNIIEAVGHSKRIFPVGRLDKYSTGLIFLTNDGDIVNKILRAQYGHEKEYVVEINQPVDADFLKKMSDGVDIGDYVTKPCRTKLIRGNTFSIVLTEGKNRQIRRMCEALGAVVKKLERIRIMNIKLGSLKPGEWISIPEKALNDLKVTLEKSKSLVRETSENLDIEE